VAHRTIGSSDRAGGPADVPGFKGQRLDFGCRRCGYGIVASRLPADGCPMCHATTWFVTRNGDRGGMR
jgi:rubrerythrin